MNEAAALRALASLIRSGRTPEQAAIEWPQQIDGRLQEMARTVAARVKLGVSAHDALEGCEARWAEALRRTFSVHASLGGDLARSIDELAARVEAWDESSSGAAAQAAGAKLSARMISLLPLAFIVFVPGPKLPLNDPIAMTFMLIGVTLVAAG